MTYPESDDTAGCFFFFSSTRILINPGVCVTFIIDPAAMATEVVLEVC